MYSEDFTGHNRALDAITGEESHLMDLIDEGEHQQLDFKYRVDSSQKIAKTLSAFANTDGGRLLIGVKDNGRIAGVDPEEEFYMIEGAAQVYCQPEVEFSAKVYRFEDRHVLEIEVPPSALSPHYAKDENNRWLAYIRQDDENFVVNRVILTYLKDKKPGSRKNLLNYGKEERLLFDFLAEHNEISLSKFAKLGGIPIHEAEKTLALFLKWELIDYRATDKGIRFYLRS
jgi:hypothetical protein